MIRSTIMPIWLCLEEFYYTHLKKQHSDTTIQQSSIYHSNIKTNTYTTHTKPYTTHTHRYNNHTTQILKKKPYTQPHINHTHTYTSHTHTYKHIQNADTHQTQIIQNTHKPYTTQTPTIRTQNKENVHDHTQIIHTTYTHTNNI